MIAFELRGLKIYWYGIFYFITFVFGYIFFYLIVSKVHFSQYKKVSHLIRNHLDNLVFMVFLGVLIGGRVGYILVYNLDYYLNNPLKIFFVWEGGLAFIGGVIGVITFLYLYIRSMKLSGKDYLLFMDLVVSVLPFGIMIGRIGNFLNQELYGRAVNDVLPNLSQGIIQILTNFKVFYIYEKVDMILRINTNLLESFFEGFLLLLILQIILWSRYFKGKINPGLIGGLFLFLYGIIRFIIEYLRDYGSDEFIGIFTKTQYFMFVFLFCGLILMLTSFKKSD